MNQEQTIRGGYDQAAAGLARGAYAGETSKQTRSPEVPEQLARLDKSIGELEACAESLFSSLSPVLQPPAPGMVPGAGAPPVEAAMQTDVGRQVHAFAGRVRSLVAQISDHRSRLGV